MVLLDTNVIIHHIRRNTFCPPESFISIVTVGELKAFAMKNKWGTDKQSRLEKFLQSLPIIDIGDKITDIYAEIDSFSQGLHSTQKLNSSARNMGKNDLWIAATAYYFSMTLQTTDNDFDHLLSFGLKLDKTNF